MVTAIRYKVPYEFACHANDLGSGKKITNTFYFVCRDQVVAPPAYGANIAGPSDIETFNTNARAVFVADALLFLNHNYSMLDTTVRSMLGKRYGTEFLALANVVPGTPVQIQTSTAHGYITGQSVQITGVTTPTGVNGNWIITVLTPTTFSLNGSVAAGVWSTDGQVQLIEGELQVFYGDKSTQDATGNVGNVAGDALPLFCTASVRRLNSGVGRNFRSRLSFSPMSESDSIDGGFTPARILAININLAAIVAGPVENGGTDAGSKIMDPVSFSKAIAFAQASPWTNSSAFTKVVSSMTVQQNTGSLVRRKPRLTAPII